MSSNGKSEDLVAIDDDIEVLPAPAVPSPAKTGPRPEKNIKCDLCSYRCSLKKSLEEHMRIVHLKLTFTCNRCEFACISAHGLREHRKSFHKEVQSTVGENLHSRLSSHMPTQRGEEQTMGYSVARGQWFMVTFRSSRLQIS